MMTTLEPARTWIAQQIRSRVVGVDPQQKNAQIFDTPGPRWFPENSPIRLVHSDASMFVGGLRALLLQSLHPLAMAGVAEHSDYRSDPWGRLQRTADFLATTTFGPAAMAEQAVAVVKRVGWALERFGASPDTLAPLRTYPAKGDSPLDPGRPARGHHDPIWNVIENLRNGE